MSERDERRSASLKKRDTKFPMLYERSINF